MARIRTQSARKVRSEIQLQSKLSDTRIVRFTKCAEVVCGIKFQEIASSSDIRFVKVHTIKDVEELGAKLHTNAFREFEILSEPHVPVVVAGIAQTSFSDVAKSAVRVCHKGRGTQPIAASRGAICRACSGPVGISHNVRPVLSNSSSGATAIAVGA